MQQTTNKWIVRVWSEDGKRCNIQQWSDEGCLQKTVARFIAKGVKFSVEALSQ